VTNGSLGGSDPNRAKQISSRATLVGPHAQAGVSLAWNDTSVPDYPFQQITAGADAGGRLGRLLVIGEFDWIHAKASDGSYDQWALYFESDFEARKGLYARFGFEAFDPLRSQTNNERDRFVFGVSWFPIQLLELRAEYRLNRDIPQRIEGNADEVVLEANGFL